jgi:hypothetical protein
VPAHALFFPKKITPPFRRYKNSTTEGGRDRRGGLPSSRILRIKAPSDVAKNS